MESCVNTKIARAHQRRHAQRIPAVIGESQESAAERQITTVLRNPVEDSAHAEFTHAVVDVIAPLHAVRIRAHRFGRRPLVRFESVRSADPPSNSGSAAAIPAMACCDAWRVASASARPLARAISARATSLQPAGNSPATRRSNSAALAGYFDR